MRQFDRIYWSLEQNRFNFILSTENHQIEIVVRQRFFFILFAFLWSYQLHSQDLWAKKQAGGNVDETLDLVSDDAGNTYSIGYFSSVADINGSSIGVDGLTDIFVSKVSSNGTTQWTVSFGGTQSDRGLGVAVDQLGNVLICGFYSGSIDFGNGVSLTSTGGQDAFLAKLDVYGNALWAKTGGRSGGSDRANAVAVDDFGNIAITGQFSGLASFGSLSLDASDGTNDVFIVKYDPDGNEIWAKQGTGESLDRGLAVAIDNSGGIYATGQFSGDITFENTYSNTIQNALFLIKYDSEGNEEWFRWGGGSEESIAYDLVSDGLSVYLTGDYGVQLTLLGSTSPINLSSGFSNSLFLLSYSQDGTYNWGISQGSNSPVSSRGMDIRSGTIAIAGFFECTFTDYSDEYGEATFNSIGFQDCFLASYSSSGAFQWARNFGHRGNERCTAIGILSDGLFAVAGVNENEGLIVPVTNVPVNGLSGLIENNNLNITHCGDSDYGKFRSLPGSGGPDGFTLKAIDPARSPFDFFQRENGMCDLNIPDACIFNNTASQPPIPCPESVISCLPYTITASNFVMDSIGFQSNYSWSPTGSTGAISLVTQPGVQTATLNSADGCYSSNDDIVTEAHPAASVPLITDSEGVNNQALNPIPILLCPGETVDLSADFPSDYTVQWSGGQFGNDPVFAPEVNVSVSGSYFVVVTTPEGCTEFNVVNVEYYNVPLDLPPLISFPTEGDTLQVCLNDTIQITLLDSISLGIYPTQQYQFDWESDSGNLQGFANFALLSPVESGWYNLSVSLQSIDNPCIDTTLTQFASDSIYIELVPVPEAFITIEGSTNYCPGDTVVLNLDYEGELDYDFDPVATFDDSLYVVGAGTYLIESFATNEFGCTNLAVDSIVLVTVQTPQVFTVPEQAVICPGDSVLLITVTEGVVTWQGPTGAFSEGNSVYVEEAGLYFAEVEFYEGCELVSNTIEITEFATPFLDGSNAVLCPGGEVEISIISTGLDAIEWLPPLSGNDTTQVVDEPGIYSVIVTGCNVTTELSIEVNLTEYEVQIEQLNPESTCEGDSILVSATEGLVSYLWNPGGEGQQVWFSEPSEVSVTTIDEYGCELISNILNLSFEPLPPLPEFSFQPVCEGEKFLLEVGGNFTVNFVGSPGGEVLTNDNPITIQEFISDTTFYVYLNSDLCVGPLDSLDVEPIPFPEIPETFSNAPVCTGENLILVVDNAEVGVTYTWLTPDGDILEGANLNYGISSLSQEGLYFTFGIREGCVGDTSAIPVTLYETRNVELPGDTALCFLEDYIISTDTAFATYLWSDSTTDSIFSPLQSGEIFITVTDFNGCESFDLMYLEFADCSFDIPNVFTPNGDGINDSWLLNLDRPRQFEVVVYNRWGRIVYESNNHLIAWDGRHYKSGEFCSEGTYFFIIRGADFEGRTFEETGDITIIRN